ncbi:Cytochrome P450 [Streptomyces sp. Ag82_O1-12]|uniref:cytochrome P450 n=1 Tax=unclassified Streptomyces TaxID=2593676 RepID=UPI000BCC59A6|nr:MULTISPECIES: cytochrome P450 [unclassified Streptomyces]SMQ18905.1 Cytochrome P450 [Streptomyces sp. Ag82_O1-12]SOD47945.1 Cytochrome P450 [Streptomyces sp. Ag82_G6-1]
MTTQPRQTVDDLTTVDLTDPQTFLDVDMPALWRRFRTEQPVFRHRPTGRGPGFWVISTYDDVVTLYRDNKRFTSERGNVLATLLQGEDSASRKMLAVTDGTRHREIRNLMLKSFSPRVLEPVVEGVHRRTRALVAETLDRGRLDFVADVADHIPINTIGDLMDIPLEDREQLVAWNTMTLSRHSADDSEMEELLARNEILLYFSDLAARRRRHPGDDVISALATATVDGEPLSEDEIVFNCYSLILGGDESSRMSSAGGLIALAEHPEQWKALKTGTVDVDSATEEVLRWTTPAMHFGRRALVDVPLREHTIRAGDVVSLWNSSANFDETVFTDPDVFDLARTPNKHVAFGHGPHFCLGAFLGRVHVNAMLDALRAQVADIRLEGPPQRLYSNFVNGYSGLPVSLTAERAVEGSAV